MSDITSTSPTPADIKTFTGWKLDLCRAVRADHKVPAGAASLFAAIMDFVNDATRKAWPSEGMLAIALGVNRKTIRKYMRILLDARWLRTEGRSSRGTTVYLVLDYRMNAVLDQLAVEIDRFRASEAERQLRRRQRRNVCPPMGTPAQGVSVHTDGQGSVHTGGHEHLQETPSFKNLYEREDSLRTENAREEPLVADEPHLHIPYPAPQTEDDLERALAELFDGCLLSSNLMIGMRKMLMAGRLTPAIVDQQRRFAA